MTISNLPPKGTSDWFPEEYRIRKYIFDTWRKVCTSFGYQEYLTPIVESAEVYRAKSGEDIGGKELMTMIDRAGRELAIRPEMTPSVTRMVTRIYDNSPKPLRFFSIANFMRNEKPQRGRNREFWQLNADIFGSDSINADVEIISMAIEIMKSFGATKDQFVVYLNDRKLIELFVTKFLGTTEENVQTATRILDKFGKISNEELTDRLKIEAKCSLSDPQYFIRFLERDDAAIQYVQEMYFKDEPEVERFKQIVERLESLGYGDFIKYNPSMIRGFDYYDGVIFEVFDMNPENNRSMFGGGRYNGLAKIFGSNSFPATGFAPGDETTKLFLESWGLISSEELKLETYFVPILDEKLYEETTNIIKSLRSQGKNVISGLEIQGFGKSLDTANRLGVDFAILFGENEHIKGVYSLKNMKSGDQSEVKI